MRNKIYIIFFSIGLILMIVSIGEVLNMLSNSTTNILRVLGALFLFIGVMMKKRNKHN